MSAATRLLPEPIPPTSPITGTGPLFHGPRGRRGGGDGRGRDRSGRRVKGRPKGVLVTKGVLRGGDGRVGSGLRDRADEPLGQDPPSGSGVRERESWPWVEAGWLWFRLAGWEMRE